MYWYAGLQTIEIAEQNSQPLDHVDITYSQDNKIWQVASCKTSRRTKIDGRRRRFMDSWVIDWELDGYRDGWFDGWIDGLDDGSLPHIQALFSQQEPHHGFPFVQPLFILPPASLGGMGSVQQEQGTVTLSLASSLCLSLSHTRAHTRTHAHTHAHMVS